MGRYHMLRNGENVLGYFVYIRIIIILSDCVWASQNVISR